MKLYTADMAPNPKRVTMFAAAKNIELELVPVNIRAGEQKTPEFLAKNPSGKIPVLELSDGTCIAETIAICRYLEAMVPDPNLFGQSALEIAQIEMQQRFIEHELFTQVGTSWVNGPIVAATGLIEPIQAAKERSDGLVNAYYQRLDLELKLRPFVGGKRFTVADITAYCIIEFASNLVGLRPSENHADLWRWYQSVEAKGLD